MPLLAADLDGRIVVLDAARARVILLDARSERVWRACADRTLDEIAAVAGEDPAVLPRVLDELAGAGLILSSADRWTHPPVRWV